MSGNQLSPSKSTTRTNRVKIGLILVLGLVVVLALYFSPLFRGDTNFRPYGPGSNTILEKTAENADWRVIVHWTKSRTEALEAYSESYRPKSGYVFQMVYLSFERNPTFKENENILKLSYVSSGKTYTALEAGHGNNEVFGDFKLNLSKYPGPNDTGKNPPTFQVYFEVPQDAQDLQFIVGSLPPIALKK